MDGRPPIENGEVRIENGVIEYVGDASTSSPTRNFGNAILMPGLVNAHTHLEYTVFRGFLEDTPFFPWVRALNELKGHLTESDWYASTQLGAAELIRSGVTTFGDNADNGPAARVASESGMRAIVYQEIFGIDHRKNANEELGAVHAKLEANDRWTSSRVRLGVSPHALYTVRPELMTLVQRYCAIKDLPTSIHVAESLAESELTNAGKGEFWNMFERRGIDWKVPLQSPTAYANAIGALNSNALAVHCVQQDREDISVMAESGASVIHCPKSNAKLGAGIAPLAEWLRTPGLRIGLGTDSAVSNNRLDMFEEMRFGLLAQRATTHAVEAIGARRMVELATIGGARAMNLDHACGSLSVGNNADMICVELGAVYNTPASDPYSALVFSVVASDVSMTMCDGQILFESGTHTTIDVPRLIRECSDIRKSISR